MLAGAAAMMLAACAYRSLEERVLERFFEACRLADWTVVSNLATVRVDPRTDGVVHDFKVVSSEREHRAASRSEADRSIAGSSFSLAGQPPADLSSSNVDLEIRRLVVDTTVRAGDGSVVPRTMRVTIQRAIADRSGERLEGRWIVTAWEWAG